MCDKEKESLPSVKLPATCSQLRSLRERHERVMTNHELGVLHGAERELLNLTQLCALRTQRQNQLENSVVELADQLRAAKETESALRSRLDDAEQMAARPTGTPFHLIGCDCPSCASCASASRSRQSSTATGHGGPAQHNVTQATLLQAADAALRTALDNGSWINSPKLCEYVTHLITTNPKSK